MNYEILSFDAANGVANVSFSDGAREAIFAIDIPIENGAFVSGEALKTHIMRYSPASQFDRMALVASADAAAVSALVAQPSVEQLRNAAKAERATYVAGIKVTTASGKTFDGDETSQTRMARAIIGLNAQPQYPLPTITWVLADNTPVQVTAAELTEALTLAGAAQAAVWVL